MIINSYDPAALEAALGIDMSTLDLGEGGPGGIGVHAGWGRVAPGASSLAHQHDETEVFVIVRGRGEIVVNGQDRHPAAPGVVALFEPFDTHVLENQGDTDLVFVTFYWRDAGQAGARAADGAAHGSADGPSSCSRHRRPPTVICTWDTCRAPTSAPTPTCASSG